MVMMLDKYCWLGKYRRKRCMRVVLYVMKGMLLVYDR